jgi:putative SOS response-associated peptidase YedK
MCTAYEIGQTDFDVDWLVADAFEASMFDEGAYQIIRPTLMAPVVMPHGRAELLKWGFRHIPWRAKKPLWVGNTREDSLKIALWNQAFKQRRCIIPATAFYEWTKGPDGNAVPLRFRRAGKRGMWIAGIWGDKEGWGRWFSMITTEPTSAIAPVHDRMPAVLTEHQIRPYLDGTLNSFGPSAAPLEWTEAENFIKQANAAKKASKPPAVKAPKSRGRKPDPDQGELL